ncbi:ABC transporter substrate-binding protein [Marinisporobacter balticus]|uniref:Iron(III) transport system substrate-binding protein n=1 Tax=Marinisporobacter balticus TaxID=2018667 RepID=A0A4R2KZK9_9FIRM|nr:extracellular solute-binding protein [Marinisporobacter balticus]TCO78652.1 iron(III) transport system substrate-binding protein [Marinisporobacter balticus]
MMGRNMKKSSFLLLTLLFVGMMVFSACSANNVEEESETNEEALKTNIASNQSIYSGKEGKITVYLSGSEPMIKKIEEEFEAERGDVIDLLHMGCGPLRQKVWTEKEAGQIQADVVWGSDPLMYMALADGKYLEKYVPKEFDTIKPQYQVGDGHYTLVNERYGVIIYNKDNVAKESVPKSFEDLKDKNFDGTMIMADANQSSTALALTSALYEMSGKNWDYLKAMHENHLFLTKKNGEVSSKISEGEFDIGIAPHDGVLRLHKKAKKDGYKIPVSIAWPEEGALSIQRPIAIIKNEARPDVNEKIAREFVDFILSKKVQNITTNFGFVSVRKDVALPVGVPEDVKVIPVDWRYASEHEDALRDGFKEIMQEK